MKKALNIIITILVIALILFLISSFIDTGDLETTLTSESKDNVLTDKDQAQAKEVKETEVTLNPPKVQYILPEPNYDYTIELDQKGTVPFKQVTFNSKTYQMRYSPDEVISIPSPKDLSKINKQVVYVTRSHNLRKQTNDYSSIAAIEFGRFTKGFETAWTTQNADTVKHNLAVKTCNDITPNHAVISLVLGPSNQVFFMDDCLIVQGKDAQGLVKTADKLAYTILGLY